jgi:hypothetical protein
MNYEYTVILYNSKSNNSEYQLLLNAGWEPLRETASGIPNSTDTHVWLCVLRKLKKLPKRLTPDLSRV